MKDKIALTSGHSDPTRFYRRLTHEYADVVRGAYAWEPCVVMKEKIALLSGHPNPTRFCLVLTHEYADVAR